jgi:hypothetical protein
MHPADPHAFTPGRGSTARICLFALNTKGSVCGKKREHSRHRRYPCPCCGERDLFTVEAQLDHCAKRRPKPSRRVSRT